MTCLLLFGPWRSSMRALSGRPSVFSSTLHASFVTTWLGSNQGLQLRRWVALYYE